ncbi:MAG: PAS domain S-box protein, partial [Vulcanimicrobiaceae bacterium]
MTTFSDADMLRLDSVLVNSPLGLVAWDGSLRISFWSNNATAIFGWTAEEMLGKTIQEAKFVHPDDLDAVLALETATRAGARKTRINVNRNVRKDGTVITCKWFNGLRQNDDRFVVVSFVEDITEWSMVEASTHESEERFRSLFVNNPDTVVIFDSNGVIADVNDAIGGYGMSSEALRGLHYTRFLRAEDQSLHHDYFRRALTGEVLRYEASIFDIEGRSLDVSVTTVPIWSHGKVTSLYSILRDQTEQMAAAAALEQSEERLRSLFEENPNPVIALDNEGLIRAINDAAAILFGRDRFDVVSKRLSDYISPEDEPLAALRFIEAMEGTPSSMLLTMNDAQGRRRELDVTMIPQFSSNNVVGAYVVMLDVTDKRLVERQLVAQAQRIRDLYAIAATTDYSPQHVQETLAMGSQIFHASVGAVVRMVGDDAMIETSYAGGRGMVDAGERVFSIARRVAERWQSGSLLVEENAVATAIVVGGELHGALVFAMPDGNTRPDPTDLDLLALMAALLGTLIERGRARESLRALAYYDTLTGLP